MPFAPLPNQRILTTSSPSRRRALDAFLRGRFQRRDVQAQQGLLQRYVRRFAEWRPNLVRVIGRRFGRDAPQKETTAFWQRAVAVCGSAAELTTQLVEEFRATCFRTYRSSK